MAAKRKTKKKAARPKKAAGAEQNPAGLESLREILFGTEQRSTNDRLDRLEDTIAEQLDSMRKELRRRITSLSNRVDKELEAVSRRFKSASSRVTRLSESFDGKLAEARKKATKSDGELRARLQADCDELRADFDERHDELIAEIQAELKALRQGKPDRAALAAMFGDFARRLGGRQANNQ